MNGRWLSTSTAIRGEPARAVEANLKRAILAPVACLVLVGLVAVPTASAGQRTKVVSHTVARSAAKATRIKHFWTPKRMRLAKPLPLAKPPTGSAPSNPPAARRPATGEPKTVPPSLPKRNPGDISVTPLATIVPNPGAYPYRTQGKIFERDRTGLYECSATVVNTPSKRVIFSAGHCAREHHIWASREVFVPGYKNGHAPYGKFAAWRWYVPNQWYYRENPSFDYSAMVLYGKVANVVGSRGIVWNHPAYQHYVSFGYPAERPFNGQQLYSCPSYLRGRDPSTGSPRTMWITCNMTDGASGGGWIIPPGNGYLDGVNSYRPPGRAYLNRIYGPYFGNVAGALYRAVRYKTP
jgi:hypothetical protein